MSKPKENWEKVWLYGIFRGYDLTEKELKWIWDRYLEVKEAR